MTLYLVKLAEPCRGDAAGDAQGPGQSVLVGSETDLSQDAACTVQSTSFTSRVSVLDMCLPEPQGKTLLATLSDRAIVGENQGSTLRTSPA